MMRAPVLPQSRERLWAVVASRLDVLESGLELVLEGLDCSGDQLGSLDGLARDGMGAPVLIALALPGDALLLPRVVAAADFLERVGDALGTAVPEGNFCSGSAARLLVVGTESSEADLRALRRLGLRSLEICRLEPFRIAGSERFAVRWLHRLGDPCAADATASPVGRSSADLPGSAPAVASRAVGEVSFSEGLSVGQDANWEMIAKLCERLDPGVRIDGDRFRRRITWRGRPLGQLINSDGTLRGIGADGSEHPMLSRGDVRVFGDLLVRRYADLAGLRPQAAEPVDSGGSRAEPERSGRPDRTRRVASRTDSLRSAMADALLSPEEFAALAGPSEQAQPDDSPD